MDITVPGRKQGKGRQEGQRRSLAWAEAREREEEGTERYLRLNMGGRYYVSES